MYWLLFGSVFVQVQMLRQLCFLDVVDLGWCHPELDKGLHIRLEALHADAIC